MGAIVIDVDATWITREVMSPLDISEEIHAFVSTIEEAWHGPKRMSVIRTMSSSLLNDGMDMTINLGAFHDKEGLDERAERSKGGADKGTKADCRGLGSLFVCCAV